ncbi:MAG: hypothetical protein AABZ60_03415, partial [Planctomycetota bacterium]
SVRTVSYSSTFSDSPLQNLDALPYQPITSALAFLLSQKNLRNREQNQINKKNTRAFKFACFWKHDCSVVSTKG